VYNVPGNSAAFFTAELRSAYLAAAAYKRRICAISGRKQVLLQDEIITSGGVV
jgi:hypothetical protein